MASLKKFYEDVLALNAGYTEVRVSVNEYHGLRYQAYTADSGCWSEGCSPEDVVKQQNDALAGKQNGGIVFEDVSIETEDLPSSIDNSPF